jgi:hypothetical protein
MMENLRALSISKVPMFILTWACLVSIILEKPMTMSLHRETIRRSVPPLHQHSFQDKQHRLSVSYSITFCREHHDDPSYP